MKSLIFLLVITLIASENLRNLGFNYNFGETYTIKTINIAGQSISFKENVGVRNGEAFHKIIIGGANFGVSGISGAGSKSYSGSFSIMKFNFPPIPTIPITLKASGNMKTSVSESGGSLTISSSGSFYAQPQVGIAAGFSSVSASGKGTIISFSRKYTISSSGSVTKSGIISSEQVSVSVTAKAISGSVTTKTYTIWNGWTSS